MSTDPVICWTHGTVTRSARWRSESGAPPPNRVMEADDRLTADEAYGLACQGTALLWRGDYHNARQLLVALGKRADRGARKPGRTAAAATAGNDAEAFHRHRQLRSQRARTLGALIVELDANFVLELRRAPDVRQACLEAYGPADGPCIMSLRCLLGLIGAHEWRVNGIDIPELGARIHPYYGVFAPIRGEYLELVATAPLPDLTSSDTVAFDIGTGTGVLAALLARRGLKRVIGTDIDLQALACARANIARLGLQDAVDFVQADLFPDGRAALVICNPPWIPARPSSALERGIFDPDSRMLRGFLGGLSQHLTPDGEGWLILSDLAEHLGLRSRAQLLREFEAAQLRVRDRHDVRPRHPRASDTGDPLHLARAAEVTSLWRLVSR
ncbi:MAG TPA: class I SAM-dependent methyltransferase [Steroidobacteraceae bacterium]|nr:class I SAM-dependent methyltransferase [Steroidobacteraceae bacterium]